MAREALYDMKSIVGTHDILFLVFDTLRYDVAIQCLENGQTPHLKEVLPKGWERRQTPGNFTYPAHQAFFAGFLPNPEGAGPHARLFAARFPGSESTSQNTYIFDSPTIPQGLAELGYRTVCIGGVGFFNLQSPLGKVLPGYFQESHWNISLGVTDPESAKNQVDLAVKIIAEKKSRRLFLFINFSAIHQPNCHYLKGAKRDNLESHGAALSAVDGELKRLFDAIQQRAPALCIMCSDHGTLYGDDGLWGHRVNHPKVLTVPYAHFILPERQ